MAKEPEQFSFYRPHKRVYADVNPDTGELVDKVSMTKQEFVAECDINNIVKLYSTTGQLNHLSAKAAQGAFDDLPDPVDFQESIHILQQAERAFLDLPAKVRDRFHQDPAQFLAFMADPANEKEARELGLLKPATPTPAPMEVRIVPQPGSPPPNPPDKPLEPRRGSKAPDEGA